MLTALCLTAVIALAVLVALVHAPLVALCALALTGAALSAGVVRPPAALADPLAGLHADIDRWQREQVARLNCRRRAVEALTSEDEQELAAAEAVCERLD